MAKYRVYMQTVASIAITVDINDEDIENAGDPTEAAIEKAYEELPGEICAQCSGWRQPWSRELGEWEVTEENGKALVEPVDA